MLSVGHVARDDANQNPRTRSHRGMRVMVFMADSLPQVYLISSLVGVPSTEMMSCSWSRVLAPCTTRKYVSRGPWPGAAGGTTYAEQRAASH